MKICVSSVQSFIRITQSSYQVESPQPEFLLIFFIKVVELYIFEIRRGLDKVVNCSFIYFMCDPTLTESEFYWILLKFQKMFSFCLSLSYYFDELVRKLILCGLFRIKKLFYFFCQCVNNFFVFPVNSVHSSCNESASSFSPVNSVHSSYIESVRSFSAFKVFRFAFSVSIPSFTQALFYESCCLQFF